MYTLVFDEVIRDQLRKAGRDAQVRKILSKFFDNLEENGPNAGKLIDSHLFIYEMKNKHPPIRLYFKQVKETNEIYVFEYEMKTSEEKQQRTITKVKFKAMGLFKK